MGNSLPKKPRRIKIADDDLKKFVRQPRMSYEPSYAMADKPLHILTKESKKINILTIDDKQVLQNKMNLFTKNLLDDLNHYTGLPDCLVNIIISYLDVKYDHFYSKFFDDQHFTNLVEKYYLCPKSEIHGLKLEILKYIQLRVHHENCSGKKAFFDAIDDIWNSVKSSTKEEGQFHQLFETFLMGDVLVTPPDDGWYLKRFRDGYNNRGWKFVSPFRMMAEIMYTIEFATMCCESLFAYILELFRTCFVQDKIVAMKLLFLVSWGWAKEIDKPSGLYCIAEDAGDSWWFGGKCVTHNHEFNSMLSSQSHLPFTYRLYSTDYL